MMGPNNTILHQELARALEMEALALGKVVLALGKVVLAQVVMVGPVLALEETHM